MCGRRARTAWPVCRAVPPSVGRSGGRPLIRKYFRREIIALFDQGRNNGEERGRKKKKRAVCEGTQNFLPPSSKLGTLRLREATLHCLSSIRYGSRSFCSLSPADHTTHIEHARGVRPGWPVETCKYYTLSVSHFLSSLSIPLATQLQLAYFNSAGKKEGREEERLGAQTRSCRAASLQEDAPRHTAQQCQALCGVAWSRRQRAAQRRTREEGEPKLLSIFPEKMMLHITAPKRPDPRQELWPSFRPFKIPRHRRAFRIREARAMTSQ